RWQAYYQATHPPASTSETTAAQPARRRQRRSLDVFANLDTAQVAERYAYVQYSLGVWWRNYAIHHPFYYQPGCELAQDFFQESLALLAQHNRDDLRAKLINALGDILERLAKWQPLAELAEVAIALHQQYPNPFRLARAYSFAAAAALGLRDYDRAIAMIQQSLDLSAQTPPDNLIPKNQIPNREWVRSYNRGSYHFILAQAQLAQGEIELGVENLERAKLDASPQYEPRLYLDILSALHDAYFDQQDYLSAYHYKKQGQSIRQQFGFTAFVGAVQLRPRQRLQTDEQENPTEHQQGGVAPEIRASGREADINKIRERLSRTEYKLTILYGPSGVGKSSLIRAGLLPALTGGAIATRDLLVVYTRIYTHWHQQLLNQFNSQLAIYPQHHSRVLHQVDDCSSLEAMLQQCRLNADRNQLLTVLVFDQFEEFFVNNKSATERRRFYDFFGACLEIPYVKILISLREDYLFHLLEINRYRPLGAINQNILDKNILYYVGNFTVAQAHNIITELTTQAHFYIESALITELVQELARDQLSISPVELQVVGEQLQAENITTLAQYREKGTKEWLVQRYLERVMVDCGPENAAIAQLVLYTLTDEDSTRPLKTHLEIEQALRQSMDNPTSFKTPLELVLDIFVAAGMVFLLPSTNGNQYQLVHDYLVPFIRKQQEEQLVARLQESERQRQQSEQRRLLSEARLNRVFRLTALGSAVLALVLAGMTLVLGRSLIAQRRARFKIINSELNALTHSSQVLLRSDHVLDALLAALQGGRKLQAETAIGQERRRQVMSALQQSVFWVQERNRLVGHEGTIQAVRFSPDGQRLVSVSRDRTVRLWRRDGTLLKTLRSHQSPVNGVVFEPATGGFITAGGDRQLRFWSAQGGAQESLDTPHQAPITHLARDAAGDILATGDSAGSVLVWDANRELLHRFESTSEPITALAVTPDGQAVVAGTAQGEVWAWDVEQGRPLQQWSAHDRPVTDIAVHPDTAEILTVSQDRTLKHWSLQGELRQEQIFEQPLLTVQVSPNGERVAVSQANKTIQLLDPQEGQVLRTLVGHDAQILSLDFSPNGLWVASAGGDQVVRLWDTDYDFIQVKPFPATQRPTAAQFAPSGEVYAVADSQGALTLYQHNGQEIWTTTLSDQPLTKLVFNAQGTALAVASPEGQIWLWRNEQPGEFSPEPTVTIAAHERAIRHLAFSADGEQLASASDDRTTRLWSFAGEPVASLFDQQAAVVAIAFHPRKDIIALGDKQGQIQLWSDRGRLLQSVSEHHGPITDLTFSPDGRWLASASEDNTLKLWTERGQLRSDLTGHTDVITRVQFSANGGGLATASLDQTVKLWDIDGTLITTLGGHKQGVRGLSFHPSDPYLITVSDDRRLIIWDLQLVGNLDLLVERGCYWVAAYLQNNPALSNPEQQLCEGVEISAEEEEEEEEDEQ
ncbi:MAG: NACHT and WD repeat domain-containing protein, partial [Spirulinaceae cyanobacterium]